MTTVAIDVLAPQVPTVGIVVLVVVAAAELLVHVLRRRDVPVARTLSPTSDTLLATYRPLVP